jgi:hypothetical protein
MTRPFARPDVARVFRAYPGPMRRHLMRLRQLIFDTAARLDSVGPLEETLRWGEPAYVTTSGSGSTIRIDRRRKHPTQLAACISAALTYHRERPRGRSRSLRA